MAEQELTQAEEFEQAQDNLDVEGEESEGMIAFWTDHFSDYAIVDSSMISVTSDESAATSGGTGSADYVLFLIGLFAMALASCRRHRIRV